LAAGEDLDGYAGAGLYDSIPMNEWREEAVSHDSDPLMADGELQRQVLEAIAKVGKAVEDALGSAQVYHHPQLFSTCSFR
jgi:hypothetical protein